MTGPPPPSDDPRALFPWLPPQRIEPSREQLRAEALLSDIPLFSEVPPRHLRDIALIARRETFRAGETIVRMGEPGSTLYVLHSGRVNVVRDRGGQAVILASLGPGEFFGELALFDSKPRAATVVVAEDAETLSLDRAGMLRILKLYPDVVAAILSTLCARLRSADDLLENLGRTSRPEPPAEGS